MIKEFNSVDCNPPTAPLLLAAEVVESGRCSNHLSLPKHLPVPNGVGRLTISTNKTLLIFT